jgi:hypothetical protein
MEAWQEFERDIQHRLGLDSTPASGSQFYAPGDAVDNRHLRQSRFAILADCKVTEKGSFALNRQFLAHQVEGAVELGKRFILPLRFWHHGDVRPEDYVVSTLDDFDELVENRRTSHAHQLADIDQVITEIERGYPMEGLDTVEDLVRVIRSILNDYKVSA